jgi:hypothetical protein
MTPPAMEGAGVALIARPPAASFIAVWNPEPVTELFMIA